MKRKKRSMMKFKGKFLHRFSLEDNIPFLIILCTDFNLYNEFKNKFIIENSLTHFNSNINLSFIDAEDFISIEVTSTPNFTYEIKIKDITIIEQPLLFDGEFAKLSESICISSGLYLRIGYCGNEPEEFIINVKNVSIDGIKHPLKLESDTQTFLTLPKPEWYKDGQIMPGGTHLGWFANEEEKHARIIFEYPNEQIYKNFEEVVSKGLIIERGYAKNLSFRIEEINEDTVLVQSKLTGATTKNVGWESTVQIKISDNYLTFKNLFSAEHYAWIGIKIGTKIVNSRYAKTSNVIFIDDSRRNQLITWMNPMDLILDGEDTKKKVLINNKTLEVGIYKYFLLEEFDNIKLRMIINELVANKIGSQLGMPVVDTYFHMEANSVGIISKLIPPPVVRYEAIKGIDFDNIVNAHQLVETVAFDIFLCNKDRHDKNICFSVKDRSFTPFLIDHGRCLGGVECDSFNSLALNECSICLCLVGLENIADRISQISDFDHIINKICSLDISGILDDLFDGDIQVLLTAYEPYGSKNIVNELDKALHWRQDNISNIIKKSLDL